VWGWEGQARAGKQAAREGQVRAGQVSRQPGKDRSGKCKQGRADRQVCRFGEQWLGRARTGQGRANEHEQFGRAGQGLAKGKERAGQGRADG